MLLRFPPELQSDILSFLPRRDLASVVRTSQHLHTVGVRILYEHVELKSFDQVEAFFQLTSLLRQGSPAALRHAEVKRAQWECIKTLEIILTFDSRKEPVANLPRSLRGRGVQPLPLERLRVSLYKHAAVLLPLLQCFDPREVGLSRTEWSKDKTFDVWTTATGWRNVTHLTLIRHLYFSPPVVSSLSGIRNRTPFPQVKTASLICWDSPFDENTNDHLEDEVGRLLRNCPGLDKLQIRVRSPEYQLRYEEIFRNGMAGKPASVFSVSVWPFGADIWGEGGRAE